MAVDRAASNSGYLLLMPARADRSVDGKRDRRRPGAGRRSEVQAQRQADALLGIVLALRQL